MFGQSLPENKNKMSAKNYVKLTLFCLLIVAVFLPIYFYNHRHVSSLRKGLIVEEECVQVYSDLLSGNSYKDTMAKMNDIKIRYAIEYCPYEANDQTDWYIRKTIYHSWKLKLQDFPCKYGM